MREFKFRVPDLDDGKRFVSSARKRVGAISEDVLDATGAAARNARKRLGDLDAPRVPLVDAHRLVKASSAQLESASRLLQEQHDETAAAVQELGEAELAAYDGPVRRFVTLFERMKNVELSELTIEEAPAFVRSFDVDVRAVDFGAVDAFKTLIAGGGVGATAGLTTFAAVGTLATASTGTAIGSLSGAAATNATLAWLGGGSLAAGGGGMAAGTMVLGGLVALPVLAVGGLVVHHKGRQALAEAKQDAAKAELAITEMELARTVAHGIMLRASRITILVVRLSELARSRNAVLGHLVDRNDDYATYDEHDREAVMLAVSGIKTLRTVMDVPVIDDDGTLTTVSSEAIDAAEQFLSAAEGAGA
jgi:hypothetical protein